jgi:hypothetical protein
MTSPYASAEEEFSFVKPQSPILRGRPAIGRPGIAEIKPHTISGITRGVRQLIGRPPHTGDPERWPQRWLVTYFAEGKDPRSVRIFAYHLKPKKKDGKVQWERLGPWELRRAVIQPMIPFPSTDNPGFFGMAIEGPEAFLT